MNPAKVDRKRLSKLSDLPNVGPAMTRDLLRIGIKLPQDLRGQDPLQLYESLCQKDGVRHDPCVLDVFISITRFMDGDASQVWWAYTAERKNRYPI